MIFRRIITAIILCFIMLSFFCAAALSLNVISPQDLVRGYSSVVEVIGKSQLTSKVNLIGERCDKKDDYTGRYKCTADKITGRDVAYGGCSLKELKIKVKGKIDCDSGEIKIKVRKGSEVCKITVGEDGSFSEVLSLKSGSNYFIVEYIDFTGSIEMYTEYAE